MMLHGFYELFLGISCLGMTEAKWWRLRKKYRQMCQPPMGFFQKLRSRILNARYKYYMENHGAFIPIDSDIMKKPVLPHGIHGIFISKKARIGENVTIFQQVTIGSNTIKGSKTYGVPVVGNNVYIGAGAKIIGAVHIGDNVRIGANCVVTIDIPDNTTVVMEKPRIICKKEIQINQWVNIKDAEF